MEQSGLLIEGQVRHLGLLRHAGGDRLIVVARNNDRLQVLRALRKSGAAPEVPILKDGLGRAQR